MEELRFIISHRTAEDLKIFLGIAKINVNQPMFVGGPTALDSLIEAYLFNKRKNQVKEKIEILVAHQGTSLVIKSNFTFLNPMENASVNKDEWLMKLLLASNKRFFFLSFFCLRGLALHPHPPVGCHSTARYWNQGQEPGDTGS
jgi:hypothetical protein